ncbi:MAG TPA: sigma factor [Candidatus Hydrogenedentes bacterium]|nr:sigma factor [Candidatus Hydrogenedentota bacterium]
MQHEHERGAGDSCHAGDTARAATPSPEIVASLVENHREFLAFVERRVRDRALAEDILQEAFVRGIDRIGELREGRWLGVQCRSLHIPNLQAEDSGTYYCHYTDGAGKDTYAVYTVTIRVAEELPAASAPLLALAVLLAAVLGAGCLGRKRGCLPSVAG